MNTSAITHAELDLALSDLRFGVDPSDLHGSLTGYLCAGGVANARNWLQRLEIDTDDQVSERDRHALLDRLFRDCRRQLEDPELGFEPLLPGDDQPLSERADALVQWCRGFLGGFGLSGAGAGDAAALSGDSAEILRDFGTIAGTRFEYEDAEEDESALAEVLEFIRVGVLLLHTEMTAPADGRRGTVH
ncbi:UPF0149 family protein [Tahibacter soli]|jgi:hypothetical protein|uniref:UPF0149 family protein n=1 Tax=Tahibacter soli TaxID=2983605 RepID=A0A9X3YMY5_9GAMM|nr:UPF0149 family protein [Tahibacter soli]MDC8013621.1 UPF0149 family protein [Tahibacter soli]